MCVITDRRKSKLAAENLKRQVESIKATSLQSLRRAANDAENKCKEAETKVAVAGKEISAAQSRIKDLERRLKQSKKR